MTEDPGAEILSDEERDILQEIMNIGFGSAAADLASVIDLYVQLSVPSVNVTLASELPGHFRREIPDSHEVSIIEQNFWSRFTGIALVAFTAGAGKALLALLGDMDGEESFESDPMGVLEKETLMEVGNILVGACVGKVAELLGDVVTYSPPRVLVGNLSDARVSKKIFDPGNYVIILQTVFHFGKQDVQGDIFLIASHESIGWLKQALQAFMKQYE